MELEPPRFGGAIFAVVTVALLGFASAFFGVALSSEAASMKSADPSNILSVSEASAAVEGSKIRRGVMVERVRPGETSDGVSNNPWLAAIR
jgi:hypothetical protein